MKAREIRIGNLVTIENEKSWSKLKNIPLKVTGYKESKQESFPLSFGIVNLTDGQNDYSQFDEFIFPITLTEEWFNKFDIKNNIPLIWIDDNYSIDLEFSPTQGQDTNGRYEIWVYYNNSLLITVQYVHQLQNVYFTLIGKELILKETK